MKWLLTGALVLSLAGCASPYKKLDESLKTALAGEPVVITENTSNSTITLTSSADYIYPSGDYRLQPGAPVLSKLVPTFRGLHHTTITIIGYTDTTPIGFQLQMSGITDNDALSLKRAEAASDYFESQGVQPALLEEHGLGERNPVAANDTPEGRARNRRIVIVLHGDGS